MQNVQALTALTYISRVNKDILVTEAHVQIRHIEVTLKTIGFSCDLFLVNLFLL